MHTIRRASRRDRHIARRPFGQLLEEPALLRKAPFLFPARSAGERLHGDNGLILALSRHGEITTVAHDSQNSWKSQYRSVVDRPQPCFVAWRTHDPRVHHAHRAQVLYEYRLTQYLRRDVDARPGASHHPAVRRIPER